MIHIDIKKELYGSNGKMTLDVNLDIQEGDFVALAGKSGSGKTTLLRILAGLEEAKGKLKIGDQIWLDDSTCKPVQKRGIGFVFQDYALFPNMSVMQNLLFVKKDEALAEHLLGLTELSELRNRHPSTLSGGQQQRVSLCRALMHQPKLLLMDEPLSALDPVMRAKLQQEILMLHKEFDITTILVSHDPSEMYRLANRVIVVEQGKAVQDGNPREVLLQTNGSQKFSFEGELLEIRKVDVIYVAIVSIGQQIVEVVVTGEEAGNLQIGQIVRVGTKAFAPTIS
jgi:molybdate transport system ATP-binding protein